MCYWVSAMILFSQCSQAIVHSHIYFVPPPPPKRILISIPLLNVIILYYDVLFSSQILFIPMSPHVKPPQIFFFTNLPLFNISLRIKRIKTARKGKMAYFVIKKTYNFLRSWPKLDINGTALKKETWQNSRHFYYWTGNV